MADFYKVLKADPLGEPYTPNVAGAKPIQSYWCQVEGQEKAVMIGKQVRDDGVVPLVPGQHVYGDLMYAKSQKGNEYWKLKSAKIPDDVVRPADSPAQATAQAAVGAAPANMSGAMPDWFKPISNQIDYIFREMKKVDGDNVIDSLAAPAEQQPLIKPEDITGEPMPQEAIDALNGVFNEPEPPEEK